MSETIKPLTKKDGETKDLVATNVERLKKLFPEIVTEGKVDFEALKEVLGDFSDDSPERYSFTWNGKSKARKIAMTPSMGTLRPAPEESVNWDTTENVFIEGDNLEVLKLLQRSYHKKIKMIYIDPPYNTGNDFVYNDDFKDNLSNYLKITGQKDGEGNKITSNPETSGRYHTDWLNMMYPRLKLARELLREDGVIFISIDENEVANLRKVCDEIFGEENFLADIAWEKRYTRSNNSKTFASVKESLLCYRKSDDLEYIREPRNDKANSIYSNPDNDPRGPWTSVSYVNPATKEQRPNLTYKIKRPGSEEYIEHPTNAWKYQESIYKKHAEENRLHWGENNDMKYPRLKRFLSELDDGMVPIDLWTREEAGTTDEGSNELKNLFNAKVFDFPKPSRLMKKAIGIGTSMADTDGIILDFFGGSCPTAQAVLEANMENQKNLRFIMVQLPEAVDVKNEAFKEGYHTIAEIGKERIRRVIKKLSDENPDYKGDLGFKVFKLDASNIKPWDASFEDVQLSLEDSIENVKPNRSEEDVLYEILLKYGLDLTLPIQEKEIAGAKVFVGGAGALVLCLSPKITTEVVDGIAKLKEELNPELMRVVFRDSGFKDDVVKTNAVQILKQHGIEDMRSI